MGQIKFEWDPKKAAANAKKYGETFDEARANIDKRPTMKKEYDFSNARKNPYATQLKKQITIRLDEDSIGYFKGISEQVGPAVEMIF